MNHTVYKVVRRLEDGKGGRLVSAIINGEAQIEYIVGKVIKPKVGRVLAFSNMSSAQEFAGNGWWKRGEDAQIYRAESIDEPMPEKYLASVQYNYNEQMPMFVIEDHWGGHVRHPLINAPNGTVSCAGIKLISLAGVYSNCMWSWYE